MIEPKASVMIAECVIAENIAGSKGGGISVQSTPGYEGEVHIVRCEILDNSVADPAAGIGGGIAVEGAGPVRIVQSVIRGNTAPGGGGGIAARDSRYVSLQSCLVVTNHSTGLSPAVLIVNTGAWADVSTFAENTSTSGTQALFGSGTGSREVMNSIIWGHGGADVSGFSVGYSCVEDPLVSGPGMLHDDPLFASAAGGFDFRLTRSSPCVDAALTAPETPAWDCDGRPRPADGDSDGLALADMGAYEFDETGIDRWSGADRYQTAVAAWEEVRDGDGYSWAVITTGEDFPDALSASALAGAVEGPLLLTRSGALPPSVSDALSDWGVRGVYIVGGPTAVGTAVSEELADLGYDVRRVAGADRYETAALVAREVTSIRTPHMDERAAFIARGDLFPDALAASPWAYVRRIPVLLTRPSALPEVTTDAITDLSMRFMYVCGAESAVSADVFDELDVLDGGATPTRMGGADRYETAREITGEAIRLGDLRCGLLGIATGERFPDGLAAGAACGSLGQGLVLTAGGHLPVPAAALITEKRERIQRPVVLGGTAAVDDAVAAAVLGLLTP